MTPRYTPDDFRRDALLIEHGGWLSVAAIGRIAEMLRQAADEAEGRLQYESITSAVDAHQRQKEAK